MPIVPFSALPPDARVWVFGASESLDTESEDTLLRHVDDYMRGWQAHGAPLVCARDWRDGRFLAIGVDQSSAGASGCSIDALFRILQSLERVLGTALVAGGRIFYRDQGGVVQCADRATFAKRLVSGTVDDATPVFDTTLTSPEPYRNRFERPLRESWHRELAPTIR